MKMNSMFKSPIKLPGPYDSTSMVMMIGVSRGITLQTGVAGTIWYSKSQVSTSTR